MARALSQMLVLSVVSQTNPPRFEHRRGAQLFDEEAYAEILAKALAADTEVLDPEVADAEVMDVELADAAVCSGNSIERSTNPQQGGCSIPWQRGRRP